MPKTDFLNPQEAEKINKQKWKQFWWTPCIVAYFQNQRSKTKKFTKPVEICCNDISKCYSFSGTINTTITNVLHHTTIIIQQLGVSSSSIITTSRGFHNQTAIMIQQDCPPPHDRYYTTTRIRFPYSTYLCHKCLIYYMDL